MVPLAPPSAHPRLISSGNCTLTIVFHYHFKTLSLAQPLHFMCVWYRPKQSPPSPPLEPHRLDPFRCKWRLWHAANLQPGFTAFRGFLLSGCSTLGGSGKHLEGTMAPKAAASTRSVSDTCRCDERTHNHAQAVYQFTVWTFLQPRSVTRRCECGSPVSPTAGTKRGWKCTQEHPLNKVNEIQLESS